MSETDTTRSVQMQCIVLALYFVYCRLVFKKKPDQETSTKPERARERERERGSLKGRWRLHAWLKRDQLKEQPRSRAESCKNRRNPPTKVFNSTSHSPPKDLWTRNWQTRFESRLFPESRSFSNLDKVVIQFSWKHVICLDCSTSLIQHWMMSQMEHQESTRVCKMFL